MLFVWGIALFALALWLAGAGTVRVAVGGGPAGSETLGLVTAAAAVLNESDLGLQLAVFETGGSAQNLHLLDTGRIDLATIQADMTVADGVLGVTTLYHDAYHLIAREDAAITSFADLPGKRIAIPSASSGQSGSFWFLASHYGLSPEQLNAQPMSEGAANFAMEQGQVDVVFRVRAPGNAGISGLIGDSALQLIPITQSDALALKEPAISRGVIPMGSYRGSPALPATDTPTAVLQRLLVARADLDRELVYRVTRGLYENRSEILARSRLAGFMQPLPEDAAGVIPAHPGARSYFDREKPGLVQQNARLVSALLSAFAIVVSGLLALRTYWVRSRRLRMHGFNRRLLDIASGARTEENPGTLVDYKHQLVDMLGAVVEDLERSQVNQAEFEHFSFTWQAVDALVRDRIILLSAPPAAVDARGEAA